MGLVPRALVMVYSVGLLRSDTLDSADKADGFIQKKNFRPLKTRRHAKAEQFPRQREILFPELCLLLNMFRFSVHFFHTFPEFFQPE